VDWNFGFDQAEAFDLEAPGRGIKRLVATLLKRSVVVFGATLGPTRDNAEGYKIRQSTGESMLPTV
jgi:hypothetical protein